MLQRAVTSMKTSAMCDFSQVKRGKGVTTNNRLLAEVGERGRGKGERDGISPYPLTFDLSPTSCKSYFCKMSNVVILQYKFLLDGSFRYSIKFSASLMHNQLYAKY